MTQPFLGEVRAFGFNFAPYQWAMCNGQLLPISQYSALFSLLGTYFGGNGTSNFALPNLQGQIPMHWGSPPGLSSTVLGEMQGTENVTLNTSEMAMHNHGAQAFQNTATNGTKTNIPSPTNWLGDSDADAAWNSAIANPTATMSGNAVGPAGSSLPHENMQPYLVVNFCIALAGIYPARN
jgi:microcystin-dependent protein